MGDLPSKNKKARVKAAQDLIQIGIQQLEMRDEIFLQIVHQLRDNPHRPHEIRGWQLLYFCLQSFPFHSEAVNKILTDLFRATEELETTENIGFCFTLYKWQLANATYRHNPVSPEEVTAAEEEKETFAIKVWLVNGTAKALYITGLSTALIVSQDLASKLGVTNLSEWGLFEQHRPSDSLRPIADNAILCDFLYNWSKTNKKSEDFTFLWKRRMLIDPSKDLQAIRDKSPIAANIVAQAEDDVIKGNIPIDYEGSALIIGLILFLRFGPLKNVDLKNVKISAFCPRYFPKTVPKFSHTGWIKEVVKEWKKIEIPTETAQLQLIEHLKSNPLYGSKPSKLIFIFWAFLSFSFQVLYLL